MKSKFGFYEIVKVVSNNERLKKIHGLEIIVKGKAEEDEIWSYAVRIPSGYIWDVNEDDIINTGKFANPEDYKNMDSVRLRVLPDGKRERVGRPRCRIFMNTLI